MCVIVCPLFIKTAKKSKGKKYWLSMNNYRNWHHQISNKIKHCFKEYIQEQVLCLPKMKNIELVYTVIRHDNRSFDLSNTCSVIDKFLLDALVDFGKIPDDSVRYVKKITFVYGGVDKNNGRCIVEIIEV